MAEGSKPAPAAIVNWIPTPPRRHRRVFNGLAGRLANTNSGSSSGYSRSVFGCTISIRKCRTELVKIVLGAGSICDMIPQMWRVSFRDLCTCRGQKLAGQIRPRYEKLCTGGSNSNHASSPKHLNPFGDLHPMLLASSPEQHDNPNGRGDLSRTPLYGRHFYSTLFAYIPEQPASCTRNRRK